MIIYVWCVFIKILRPSRIIKYIVWNRMQFYHYWLFCHHYWCIPLVVGEADIQHRCYLSNVVGIKSVSPPNSLVTRHRLKVHITRRWRPWPLNRLFIHPSDSDIELDMVVPHVKAVVNSYFTQLCRCAMWWRWPWHGHARCQSGSEPVLHTVRSLCNVVVIMTIS